MQLHLVQPTLPLHVRDAQSAPEAARDAVGPLVPPKLAIVGDEVVDSATNEVYSGCGTTSDWYGDCNYAFHTLDDIKDEPEILHNDMEVSAEDEFIYLAFYEDDSCTDLSTIVTSLSGPTAIGGTVRT